MDIRHELQTQHGLRLVRVLSETSDSYRVKVLDVGGIYRTMNVYLTTDPESGDTLLELDEH